MEIREAFERQICYDLAHRIKEHYPNVSKDFLVACFSSPSIILDFNRISASVISVIRSAMLKSGINEIFAEQSDEIWSFVRSKYPVYVRWRSRMITKTADNIGRVYAALKNDEEILRAEFDIEEPLRPERVRLGLGDAHRGGKGVALLEYKGGRKILYKPRNLSIDLHFTQLLAYIEKKSGVDFISPKTVARDDYGWTEFIEYKECSSEEEIKSYYFRTGGLLALLYALNAKDFHYENIICMGPFPVLIDMESFFVPYFPVEGAETSVNILDSVLGTGLLPTTIVLDTKDGNDESDKDALEICGLADVEGQDSITEDAKIVVDDNGEISVSRVRGKLDGANNVPKLGTKKVDAGEYSSEISRGFETIYSTIVADKASFVAQLNVFKDDVIRIILRDTAAYSHLLREANNVNILIDEGALRSLFSAWLNKIVPEYKFLENVVEHEIDDLMDHDIPLFTSTASSCNLWYKDDECVMNCFQETGFERVLKKIGEMSKADCEKQKWLIETSLNYKTRLSDYGNSGENISEFKSTETVNPDDALTAVTSDVRDYIIDHIQETEGSVSWLTVNAGNYTNSKIQILESSYDLFSGMPGEILFLANYGEVFNDSRSRQLALKAYGSLCGTVEKMQDSIKLLGLYKGWGSIIFLNTSLYAITGNDQHLRKNKEYFEKVDFLSRINIDQYFGVIKGCAGFILACLDYYKVSEDKESIKAAIAAADYLLANSYPGVKVGMGWKIASKNPLSGMSHGASGIALAFLRLYQQTREKKYFDAISAIVEYENSTYDEGKKNWRDLRDHVIRADGEEPFLATWAHGAGGIGLVRLEMLKSGLFDPDGLLKKDLDNALSTTILKGFSRNLSLTVGSCGNVELLQNYLEQYDDAGVREKYLLIKDYICQAYLNGEYRICFPMKSFGLMSGITGVGYECLRLFKPDKVRSVLVL